MTPRKIQRYGWKRDLPDKRDRLLSIGYWRRWTASLVLPSHFDLDTLSPTIYDQGDLGSCTANALAGAFFVASGSYVSRLMLYYLERVMEGSVSEDSGAQLRDGLRAMFNTGVCPESEWPYVVAKFKQKPPAQDFTDAKKFAITGFTKVPQTVTALKVALSVNKKPVPFGFSVYESFESETVARSGVVPMPGSSEGIVGGHAVLARGFDDSTKRVKVRNSWGPEWGMKGDFTLPYDFFFDADMVSDLWSIDGVGPNP